MSRIWSSGPAERTPPLVTANKPSRRRRKAQKKKDWLRHGHASKCDSWYCSPKGDFDEPFGISGPEVEGEHLYPTLAGPAGADDDADDVPPLMRPFRNPSPETSGPSLTSSGSARVTSDDSAHGPPVVVVHDGTLTPPPPPPKSCTLKPRSRTLCLTSKSSPSPPPCCRTPRPPAVPPPGFAASKPMPKPVPRKRQGSSPRRDATGRFSKDGIAGSEKSRWLDIAIEMIDAASSSQKFVAANRLSKTDVVAASSAQKPVAADRASKTDVVAASSSQKLVAADSVSKTDVAAGSKTDVAADCVSKTDVAADCLSKTDVAVCSSAVGRFSRFA